MRRPELGRFLIPAEHRSVQTAAERATSFAKAAPDTRERALKDDRVGNDPVAGIPGEAGPGSDSNSVPRDLCAYAHASSQETAYRGGSQCSVGRAGWRRVSWVSQRSPWPLRVAGRNPRTAPARGRSHT